MTDSVDKQSRVSDIQDWRITSGPRQIRQALDRGSIPPGVVVMDRNEVSQLMHRIIDDWKPAKEM